MKIKQLYYANLPIKGKKVSINGFIGYFYDFIDNNRVMIVNTPSVFTNENSVFSGVIFKATQKEVMDWNVIDD